MPTYQVPGLSADFTTDFEDLVLTYLFTKWSISGSNKPQKGLTAQDVSADLRFKPGFPDNLKPYEVNCLRTDTTVANRNDPNSWHLFTTVEIRLTATRLSKDNVDPELGNMEREVQRIINSYPINDINGIQDLIYLGDSRDYGTASTATGTGIRTPMTWASSRWSTVVRVNLSYYKELI